jgi:hypothetical protein
VLQVPRKQQVLLPVELQVPRKQQALPLQQAQRKLATPVPHRSVQHVFAKALQR